MHLFSRRTLLKLLAANPILIPGVDQKTAPKYAVKDANIEVHCTAGYPTLWKQVYRNTHWIIFRRSGEELGRYTSS